MKRLDIALDFETFYDTKGLYSVGGKAAMTPRQYVTDERFDPYLVSLAVRADDADAMCPDCLGWPIAWRPDRHDVDESFGRYAVRHLAVRPQDFDWSLFQRVPVRFIIHNAGFDTAVLRRMMELKMIPSFDFDVRDTADMAAFLAAPRHLKGACKILLGVDVSKEVRSNMDGRRLDDLDADERKALFDYADSDALECHELWVRYSDRWPEMEQKISLQNLRTCTAGFRVDVDAVAKGLETLTKLNAEAEEKLPWVNAWNPEDRAPAASVPALRRWFSEHGYTPPKSFNKNDAAYLNWVSSLDREKDEVALAVLDARVTHSGTNPHIARLKVMQNQLEHRPDGDFIYNSFVYFGAHTGRFTGSVGETYRGVKSVNMLNMPRKPVYGVDMRAMYVPPKGRKFVIFDYSQIEARALLWLVEDDEACKALMDPSANLYVLSAIRQGLVPPGSKKADLDPKMYQLCKQKDLALGYSMGVWTFLQRLEAADIDVDPVPRAEWKPADLHGVDFCLKTQAFLDPEKPEDARKVGRVIAAHRMVEEWRDANWRIAGKKNPETGFREGGLWRELYAPFVRAAETGAPSVWYDLPSGRRKTYFNPTKVIPYGERRPKYVAQPVRADAPPRREWRATPTNPFGAPASYTILTGGKLTENYVQAFCRDIMTYACVEVEEKLPFLQFHFSVYDEVVFSCPEDKCDVALREMPAIMCRGEYIREWTEGMPLAVDGGVADHYTK